ncbi:MAG: hypothetical protein JXA68_10860 [Ignavibacteriales bacterium]|nr:hypothetical protein [Ignavibacteriales bacterium]
MKNLKYISLILFITYINLAQSQIGINISTGLFNENIESSYKLDLSFAFPLYNQSFYLQTNMGLSYCNLNTSQDEIITGEFWNIPIKLIGLYYPFDNPIKPYLGLGICYNIISFMEGGHAIESDYGFIFSQNYDNTFSFNLIIGCNIPITKNFWLNLETLYNTLTTYTNLNIENKFFKKKWINLRNIEISTGIQFSF